MLLKWYGQSCFTLESQAGYRILMDPYGQLLGYRLPPLQADLVAVTHNHRDHNRVDVVSGNYQLVNQAAPYSFDEGRLYGVETFHDNQGGRERGNNLVYVVEMDGLRVCHCGDLGHRLTEEQLKQIGPVDILLIPVGGTRTLGAEDACYVMEQLQPTITIPMHYWTKALGLLGRFYFQKIGPFLKLSGKRVTRLPSLAVTREGLAEAEGIVILEYKHP